MGVYSSCLVLTGLEVTGWLQFIAGKMRHPSLGSTSSEGREGQGERDRAREIVVFDREERS